MNTAAPQQTNRARRLKMVLRLPAAAYLCCLPIAAGSNGHILGFLVTSPINAVVSMGDWLQRVF